MTEGASVFFSSALSQGHLSMLLVIIASILNKGSVQKASVPPGAHSAHHPCTFMHPFIHLHVAIAVSLAQGLVLRNVG